MENNPPEKNEQSYPRIQINNKEKNQQHIETDNVNRNMKTNNNEQENQQQPVSTATEEITIIPETNPLQATQQHEENLTSPSVATNTSETTPTTNKSNSDNTPTPTATDETTIIPKTNPLPATQQHEESFYFTISRNKQHSKSSRYNNTRNNTHNQ